MKKSKPLTEGRVRKGGHNDGPSQIKRRPRPPAPVNKPAVIAGPDFAAVVPQGWRLVPDRPTVEWIEEMHARTSYPPVKIAIQMMLDTAPPYGGRE